MFWHQKVIGILTNKIINMCLLLFMLMQGHLGPMGVAGQPGIPGYGVRDQVVECIYIAVCVFYYLCSLYMI